MYNIWYLITGSDGRSSKSNSESSSSNEEISKVISTKDFQIVQKLGVGGFGNVFLAKYRQNTGKSKGQLISKCLFDLLNFPKKPKFCWLDQFLDSRSDIFRCYFGKFKTSKIQSEINWPLKVTNGMLPWKW